MRRFGTLFVLVCSFLIFLSSFKYPQVHESFQSFSQAFVRPILGFGATVRDGISKLRYDYGAFWNAVSQEREYQNRISNLEAQLVFFEETEQENQRLRKILEFGKTLSFKSIGSRIIGEDLTLWHKTILLDKGKKQGLQERMVLVAPGGLVGRITELGSHTSRALLLSDPDSRVPAMAVESRAQGVVTGDGSWNLKMRYLPLDSQVSVGEDVVTSGMGKIFPKGFVIGKITSVEKGPDGLHLNATVDPSVEFNRLEEVLCLISSQAK